MVIVMSGDHYAAIQDGAVAAIIQREVSAYGRPPSVQWAIHFLDDRPALRFLPLQEALKQAQDSK